MKLKLKKQKKNIAAFVIASLFLLLSSFSVHAAEITFKSDQDLLSLKNELKRTYQMGLDYLKKSQNPDGSWSNPGFPALTGLTVYAFLTSPMYGNIVQKPEFIQKGLDFIISNTHENGAIYNEGLPNYNTSICMMALLAANDTKYHPYILKGRRYLATLQLDQGEKGKTDQKFDGGIGYGTKDHSDMSNTYIALEALWASSFLESDEQLEAYKDLKSLQKTTLDWEAALQFIQRCQNLPGTNDQAWSSADPKNKGGFVYYPGSSKAGEETLPSGKKTLRSYGSMTYAGLLSFIFAKLKKDDPRVQAAYGWLKGNFTLDENPGMGQQGLFYYYHTMAKALTVYGEDYIKTVDGQDINWRKELAIKLIQKQREDGSWINPTARWWENDPVLVSSYALISLNMITPRLK
ncbi:prenyltransferase/squalene oxidase repeat-containing protein [uncultured Desulfobacter sp.]|uniref:prenyltransferase/squalene oxidase repeat-containing protein n=1 Tax=uncultured Desulfobacter sp. TaxID=240139 RepID=UPI0029C74E4B|nr:prenyltransferase/squalene oxidase repeat-containing protein [uncultured Desulfobacter sp.]